MPSRFTSCRSLAVSALTALGLAPVAPAAITTTVSGVYDEQTTQLNAVDASASGPTTGTVNTVTAAAFATTITNAYANNSGGVINFDDVTTPTSGQTMIVAKFGAGNANTIALTGSGYQVDMGALTTINATPISGNTYLRNGDASGVQSFAFSSPVSAVGATVLARTGARNITATVTYDNNTTGSVGPVTVATVANQLTANSSPDTFFGFTAPAGRTITAISFSAGSGNFFVLDDIGFVAVPEPGTAAVLGVGAVGLLARRRRR
jgi:hypothetical protein